MNMDNTTPPPATPLHAAVYIGRFQPFHAGHGALLQQALRLAPRCVVVIGSAFQARSPKNPFTWSERAEMIRQHLAAADRERVLFVPIRDYYDEARWTAAVRAGVADVLAGARRGIDNDTEPAADEIALVGHFKDATSAYLRDFPGWRLVGVERHQTIDATTLRDAYFGATASDGAGIDAALAALIDQAPPATRAFLRAWSALPAYRTMQEEWAALRRDRAAWASAPYPPVFVTVDALLRCAGHVLLIERGHAPGKGLMALPGGFIEQRETAYQSALRELHEETGLALLPDTMRRALRAAQVFDHPDRSQRGRTITHAHYFDLGERELPPVQAGDDAAQAAWVPIERLTAMEDRFMDDHFHILDRFLGLT
ncbi:MAG TPA: bifunctional nicotinamide-nucleotide adenylyltransferase/Nudix hydroxylase [Burkholderiaceae bacterium]|nr:bifunctional nicotinamide-nucleotide adenylyltransferase/Nudix hydroxylase [Burkholderiaceae bacterium]